MDIRRAARWNRREFLGGLTLAGTAGLLGVVPEQAAAEPPPEATRIRLVRIGAICLGAQYVAEDLLRTEGFGEIRYIEKMKEGSLGIASALASGEADISMYYGASAVLELDAGRPLLVLGGGHVGCFELFANERIRAVRDLKGKTVAITASRTTDHVLVSIMLAYVGLDPQKDVRWAVHSYREFPSLLTEGKIDAFMGFPPLSQELRAKRIGHVVFNAMMDRPWSQYFCCITTGNADFVQKHPIATRRALRAILKAADVCARDPGRAARILVDRGYVSSYDYALQSMKEVNYGWRLYNPEDTLRFFALRLHEIGMIKSSPQKIVTQGTDWRFLNELKRELKG